MQLLPYIAKLNDTIDILEMITISYKDYSQFIYAIGLMFYN